jgi:dCTP deaminase
MSLLSYNELVELVEAGVIDAPIENINAASIDLTLCKNIMRQNNYLSFTHRVIDLANKENIELQEIEMDESGYVIEPGEFFLASTVEWFDLSKHDDVSAEYKLKSSMARNGLSHLLAGFADSGWSGNLTLEFHNVSNQPLLIRPGMKCGQMLFFRHAPVPQHASYANKGQYNGQQGVTASKGIR